MKNPVTSISTNGTGLRLAEKHYEVFWLTCPQD